MKLLTAILVSALAIHAASAGLRVMPEPWCVCGTWYKLKVDPWKVDQPTVPYGPGYGAGYGQGYGPGFRPAAPGLTTYNLDNPGQTMCAMQRAFAEKLANPLDFCPSRQIRSSPCGCPGGGCGCN